MSLRTIRERLALRHRIRSSLRTFRLGARPNIAIFAQRRGGSTLLADMLASEPGVLEVIEPFHLVEGNPGYPHMRKWLTPRLHSIFFDLDREDEARVREYASHLLTGRLPIGDCRRPKFPFVVDRILLKILHASALMDWLAEEFGLRVVRLLRHPAPQALSVLQRGWGFTVEAYFTRPDFLRGFLGEDQVEYGRRILAGSSPWRKAILDWCVEYHLLVHHTRRPSPLITYEELTIDPGATCRSLCDQLGLDHYDRIVDRIRMPSTSPGGCSRDNLPLILSGDGRLLIRSWSSRVDGTRAAQAQDILDRFGVSHYDMSHPLPIGSWARGAGRRPEGVPMAARRDDVASTPRGTASA